MDTLQPRFHTLSDLALAPSYSQVVRQLDLVPSPRDSIPFILGPQGKFIDQSSSQQEEWAHHKDHKGRAYKSSHPRV